MRRGISTATHLDSHSTSSPPHYLKKEQEEKERKRVEISTLKMSEMNMDDCTLATCPIDWAYINYLPNIPANVLFLAIFGLLLAAQIALGTWFRTWTYMGAMTAGLILEILGYIGRLMMHSNPFDFNAFLLYVTFETYL
jgi:hypothetical protein